MLYLSKKYGYYRSLLGRYLAIFVEQNNLSQRETIFVERKNNKLIRKKNMKKLVGQVTPDEKNEIQALFERRNGLSELAKILTADNSELYEKLVHDMGETGTKFQAWWDTMAQKYRWESCEGGNWEINFDTREIFLNCPE